MTCQAPGCARARQPHAHSRAYHTGCTIDHIATEAMGFCPEAGVPFEFCIDGPCVCPLTRATVGAYVAEVAADLVALRAARRGET